MSNTVTVELDESELDTLEDCIRWTKEYCEENGLRRVENQVTRLQTTLERQVNGDE